MSKSKATISTSESEGSDDEPRQKQVKKVAEKRPAPSSKGSSSSGGESKYEIGRMRFVGVSEFRGKKMINIREYYQADDGEARPGKKGISLSVEQWEKLKSYMDDVDADLRK